MLSSSSSEMLWMPPVRCWVCPGVGSWGVAFVVVMLCVVVVVVCGVGVSMDGGVGFPLAMGVALVRWGVAASAPVGRRLVAYGAGRLGVAAAGGTGRKVAGTVSKSVGCVRCGVALSGAHGWVGERVRGCVSAVGCEPAGKVCQEVVTASVLCAYCEAGQESCEVGKVVRLCCG